MPIDASIPARFAGMGLSLPNPIEQYSTLAALKQQAAQAEALKAQQQKDATIAQLLPQVLDPNSENGLNMSVFNQLAAIDPEAPVKIGRLRDLAMPQFNQKGGQYLASNQGYYDANTRQFIKNPDTGEVLMPASAVGQTDKKPPKREEYEENGFRITEQWNPEKGEYEVVRRVKIEQKEPTAKGPTDAQQKYAFFASRGESALNELEGLFKKGYRPSENVIKYLSMNPSDYSAQILRKSLSPADVQFASMAPRALTSILRPESGAVIGPDEIGTYLQSYIPVGNEGLAKLGALRNELANLRQMSRGGLPGEITAPGSVVGGQKIPAAPKKADPKKPDRNKAGVKF